MFQGQCSSSDDCLAGRCSPCNDNSIFPESLYSHITQGVYKDDESCCRYHYFKFSRILLELTFVFRRNCISTEPCDYLRPGCASDADCKTGLTCGLVGVVPTCLDLDECAQNPDICGSDTCINLISTYRYVKVIMGFKKES